MIQTSPGSWLNSGVLMLVYGHISGGIFALVFIVLINGVFADYFFDAGKNRR